MLSFAQIVTAAVIVAVLTGLLWLMVSGLIVFVKWISRNKATKININNDSK